MNGNYEEKANRCSCLQLFDGSCYCYFGSSSFKLAVISSFCKNPKNKFNSKNNLSNSDGELYTALRLFIVAIYDKLQMSNFPTSSSAARHFYECKLLFELAIIVFVVGLLILIFLKMRKRMSYIYISRTTALIFMILPVIILPFALMNFDEFFIAFHHLLFNNGDWLFNPATDPIINVLTEEFFAGCFATGGIIYELYFSCFILSKKKEL